MALVPSVQEALSIANAAQRVGSNPAVQRAAMGLLSSLGASAGRAAQGFLRKTYRGKRPSERPPKRKAKHKQPGANSNAKVFSSRSAAAHPIHVKSSKGKSKKRSVKDRVKALEKRAKATPLSVYKFVDVRPYTLSTEAQESRGVTPVRNRHGKMIYQYAGLWTQSAIQTKMASSIPKTDDENQFLQTANKNSRNYVKRHVNLTIKNTGRTACVVKYVRYRSKDHNTIGILDDLKNYCTDRIVASGILEAAQGSVATVGSESSYHMGRLVFNDGNGYQEQFQFLTKLDNYKTIGKVGTTILQPGDFFHIYDTHNAVMESEVGDRNGSTNPSPFNTYGFMIEVKGCIATDASNFDHVGTSDFQVSAMAREYMTLKMNNDLGQHHYDYDIQAMNTSANGWTTGAASVIEQSDE